MASAEVYNLPNGKELFRGNSEEKELSVSSKSELKNKHLVEEHSTGAEEGTMFDDAFDMNDVNGEALEENGSLSDASGKGQECNLCQ